MKKDRDHTKSRRTKAIENRSPLARLTLCALKSTGIAFLAALAFIFIGGWIGYSLRDPAGSASAVSLTAIYLSFFACGFASSRIERGSPLATGAFSACVYLAAILVISLAVRASASVSRTVGERVLIAALTFPCAVVGSFVGNMRIASRRSRVYGRRR